MIRDVVSAHSHVVLQGYVWIGVYKGAAISMHKRCYVQTSGVAAIALTPCIHGLHTAISDFHILEVLSPCLGHNISVLTLMIVMLWV